MAINGTTKRLLEQARLEKNLGVKLPAKKKKKKSTKKRATKKKARKKKKSRKKKATKKKTAKKKTAKKKTSERQRYIARRKKAGRTQKQAEADWRKLLAKRRAKGNPNGNKRKKKKVSAHKGSDRCIHCGGAHSASQHWSHQYGPGPFGSGGGAYKFRRD